MRTLLIGVLLVSLRSPETNYLPKGRLAAVAATLKVSRRELSDRMRVAEAYRTDAAFQKAAQGCRQVWTCLLRSLPPTREARTGSTRPPKNWRRMVYDGLGLMLDGRAGTREQRHHAQKLYDLLNDGEGDDDAAS